jgi:hypothetical protein
LGRVDDGEETATNSREASATGMGANTSATHQHDFYNFYAETFQTKVHVCRDIGIAWCTLIFQQRSSMCIQWHGLLDSLYTEASK